MTVAILNGCALKPKMVMIRPIPSSLADNIVYGKLMGNYGFPVPEKHSDLVRECTNRGKDVVMLITSIKNKNSEMAAVRRLNEDSGGS